MTEFVRVVAGEYRKAPIQNTVFPQIRGYQIGAKGGYVTVDATHMLGEGRQIRVLVANKNAVKRATLEEYMAQGENCTVAPQAEPVAVPTETEEQAIERIRERFEILHEMTKASVSGDIRAMIVSGPPGVGKSYGIEQEIEKATLFDQVAGRGLRAEVIKGSATPIGLYQTLYKYSDPNCVVVFDDCDSILLDDVSLNLLKGALDSGKKRKISWLADSRVLRDEGIPSTFEFKGSAIFITNLKFDKMKSQKLRDHLDALQSRCHYLDLTLDTVRDRILRIKQIAGDGALFQDYDFDKVVQDEIIDFMTENSSRLREISLRMAIKIADLRKMSPTRWKRLAETTCMKVGD